MPPKKQNRRDNTAATQKTGNRAQESTGKNTKEASRSTVSGGNGGGGGGAAQALNRKTSHSAGKASSDTHESAQALRAEAREALRTVDGSLLAELLRSQHHGMEANLATMRSRLSALANCSAESSRQSANGRREFLLDGSSEALIDVLASALGDRLGDQISISGADCDDLVGLTCEMDGTALSSEPDALEDGTSHSHNHRLKRKMVSTVAKKRRKESVSLGAGAGDGAEHQEMMINGNASTSSQSSSTTSLDGNAPTCTHTFSMKESTGPTAASRTNIEASILSSSSLSSELRSFLSLGSTRDLAANTHAAIRYGAWRASAQNLNRKGDFSEESHDLQAHDTKFSRFREDFPLLSLSSGEMVEELRRRGKGIIAPAAHNSNGTNSGAISAPTAAESASRRSATKASEPTAAAVKSFDVAAASSKLPLVFGAGNILPPLPDFLLPALPSSASVAVRGQRIPKEIELTFPETLTLSGVSGITNLGEITGADDIEEIITSFSADKASAEKLIQACAPLDGVRITLQRLDYDEDEDSNDVYECGSNSDFGCNAYGSDVDEGGSSPTQGEESDARALCQGEPVSAAALAAVAAAARVPARKTDIRDVIDVSRIHAHTSGDNRADVVLTIDKNCTIVHFSRSVAPDSSMHPASLLEMAVDMSMTNKQFLHSLMTHSFPPIGAAASVAAPTSAESGQTTTAPSVVDAAADAIPPSADAPAMSTQPQGDAPSEKASPAVKESASATLNATTNAEQTTLPERSAAKITTADAALHTLTAASPDEDNDWDTFLVQHEGSDEVDVREIRAIASKLEHLSEKTLRAIGKEWGLSDAALSKEPNVLRETIASNLRFLAISIVYTVAENYIRAAKSNSSTGSVGDTTSGADSKGLTEAGGSSGEAASLPVPADLLQAPANVFTMDALRMFIEAFRLRDDCLQEELAVAMTRPGILSFFSPLPLKLLATIEQELGLPTDMAEKNGDLDLRHEDAARRISYHLYPAQTMVQAVELPFMPRLQVHENAPGRYTFTIDNARLMYMIGVQRLVSNRFSCNKVRWRAALSTTKDGNMIVAFWHHGKSLLKASIALRATEPRGSRNNKNKRNQKQGDEDEAHEALSPLDGPLNLQLDAVAFPGEEIGFPSFAQLSTVLQSYTSNSTGLKIYNKNDDRVIFQYTMTTTAPSKSDLAAKNAAEHDGVFPRLGRAFTELFDVEGSDSDDHMTVYGSTDDESDLATTADACAENEAHDDDPHDGGKSTTESDQAAQLKNRGRSNQARRKEKDDPQQQQRQQSKNHDGGSRKSNTRSVSPGALSGAGSQVASEGKAGKRGDKSVGKQEQSNAEKSSKLTDKQLKALEKVMQKVVKEESQSRDSIVQMWTTGRKHMEAEMKKGETRAKQREEDADRKVRLARAVPDAALEKALKAIKETVAVTRAQVTKLNTEKQTGEEQLAQIEKQTAENQREIEKLKAKKAELAVMLKEIDRRILTSARRKKEKEARIAKKLKYKDYMDHIEHAAEPNALAIHDMQLFWSSSTPPLRPQELIFSTAPQPTAPAPLTTTSGLDPYSYNAKFATGVTAQISRSSKERQTEGNSTPLKGLGNLSGTKGSPGKALSPPASQRHPFQASAPEPGLPSTRGNVFTTGASDIFNSCLRDLVQEDTGMQQRASSARTAEPAFFSGPDAISMLAAATADPQVAMSSRTPSEAVFTHSESPSLSSALHSMQFSAPASLEPVGERESPASSGFSPFSIGERDRFGSHGGAHTSPLPAGAFATHALPQGYNMHQTASPFVVSGSSAIPPSISNSSLDASAVPFTPSPAAYYEAASNASNRASAASNLMRGGESMPQTFTVTARVANLRTTSPPPGHPHSVHGRPYFTGGSPSSNSPTSMTRNMNFGFPSQPPMQGLHGTGDASGGDSGHMPYLYPYRTNASSPGMEPPLSGMMPNVHAGSPNGAPPPMAPAPMSTGGGGMFGGGGGRGFGSNVNDILPGFQISGEGPSQNNFSRGTPTTSIRGNSDVLGGDIANQGSNYQGGGGGNAGGAPGGTSYFPSNVW